MWSVLVEAADAARTKQSMQMRLRLALFSFGLRSPGWKPRLRFPGWKPRLRFPGWKHWLCPQAGSLGYVSQAGSLGYVSQAGSLGYGDLAHFGQWVVRNHHGRLAAGAGYE